MEPHIVYEHVFCNPIDHRAHSNEYIYKFPEHFSNSRGRKEIGLRSVTIKNASRDLKLQHIFFKSDALVNVNISFSVSLSSNDNMSDANNKFKKAIKTKYIEYKDEIENITPQIISKNDQIKNLREKYTDSLDYIKGHDSVEHNTKNVEDSELIVLGSGNLGLIYLTQWKQRLNYEEIVMLFPDLIPGLVKHSGIGFILVNSISNGGMVIGQDGIYYLDNDEIVGENPLKGFGKNAARHLRRENSFKNMPTF